MKKISIFLVLLIICASVFSQKRDKHIPTPPNGVWMRNNLFMDKTEITNISWLEYMHYLAKDSSYAIYSKSLPDTLVWLSFQDTVQIKTYLRSPGKRYFPVVGISYEQAVNYCKWRSNAVNIRIHEEGARFKKIRGEDKYDFHFRLPTEKEWIEAAAGGLDIQRYPYGYLGYGVSPQLKEGAQFYYEKTNKLETFEVFDRDFKAYLKSKDEASFNIVKSFKSYFEYGDYLPSFVYDKRKQSNPIGLYDMIGNISEMVIERGLSKGGSWAHNLEGSKINKAQVYRRPEAWLGFRCICEVTLVKEDK